MGKWYDYIFWHFTLCFEYVILRLFYDGFYLWFWPILLCFYYNNYFHQHNYYDSIMNTFDSDYPFDDFLEYSKFYELSKFLQ